MSAPNLSETQPMVVKPNKKKGVWKWILLGLGIILALTAAGGGIGYASGISFREKTANNQRALAASTQYQLSLADFAAGNYLRAKDRLVYVIQLDPGYAGAKEKLAEVLITMASTATPTTAPSATVAPTLDLSGVEAMLAQAKQLMAGGDFNGVITALDNIRKSNASFKTAEVDGLYYLALRNRGLEKITQQGYLEGGIYDLTVASRFGPIDGLANSTKEEAEVYITAASFWEVNWEQALFYFEQIYTTDPYLHDINNWTAVDRYRMASVGYGDQLMTKNKYCEAQQYYQNAANISADNKTSEKLLSATNKCNALTATEVPIDTTTPPPAADTTVTVPPVTSDVTPPPVSSEAPVPEG